MAKLKVGRNIVDIGENKGACYQIITKRIGFGFNESIPIMSKKLFAELKKCELIFTSEGLRQAVIERYGNSVVAFWKFNIDQMQKMGY